MSLDYSLKDIVDYEQTCYIKLTDGFILCPAVEALIWLSIPCGFNSITKKNWKEVFKRIYIEELLTGARRSRHDQATNTTDKVYFTPEEVCRYIGLKTNASTLTLNQYGARLVKSRERDANNVLRHWEAKQNKEAA